MKGYNPRFLKMRGAMQDIVVTQMGDMPVVRGRSFTNDSNTPRQQAARTSFGGHNTKFAALPPLVKNGWLILAQQVHDPARKRPLSAANCYTMVNSALQSAGLPTTDTAPTTVDTPVPILNVSLTTTTGTGSAKSFALIINSEVAWDGPVLVMGFDAQLLGVNHYDLKKAVPLGVLPTLNDGATTVTGMFTARFGVPQAGTKVALLLARVSLHGFKSPTTFIESPYLLTADGAQTEGGDLHVA